MTTFPYLHVGDASERRVPHRLADFHPTTLRDSSPA